MHHSHACEELDEAFLRCKNDVLFFSKATKEALEALNARCDEISNQRVAIEEQIHSTISIDEVKTELISQLHQLTQIKLKTLAVQRDQIETIQAQLNKHLFFRDTSNQEETLQMKSTAIKQVKSLTTTIREDMLEPNTDADTFFVPPTAEHNAAGKNINGMVYASSSPDPSKCRVSGIGATIIEQKFTTLLQTFNSDNLPCKLSSSISCKLVASLVVGHTVKGNIERKAQSLYEISFQPTIKGMHQLHLKVEGQHIRGSPFSVSVRSPVDKLGVPILCIKGVRRPMGAAVNSKGEVVVTEWGGHCVTVFSPSGERLRSLGTCGTGEGQLQYPCGITLDGDENIVVTDWRNCRVQMFTPQGEFLRSIDNGAFKPCGIMFNASNSRLYVVDESGCIQILNSDLSHFSTFGKRGIREGEFSRPRHIACDSVGNVYVTDYFNRHIQVFTAEGDFLKVFTVHGGGDSEVLKKPYGLALDFSDKVYVGDLECEKVLVYTSEGQFVTSLGGPGNQLGQFVFPAGLAVDNSGVVYVCDHWNDRVQVC